MSNYPHISENRLLTKHRSPWQRSHSHPVNLRTSDSRVLQPISELSKNKLQRFKYQLREDAERENRDATPATAGVTHGDEIQKLPKDDHTAAAPSAHLSWQDLMEPDHHVEDDLHVSPNERIMWDSRQNFRSTAVSPLLPRKGKKRARSSSPTSSPATEKPMTPAVNIKKLAKALKSPHADPTLELWDRYSIVGNGSPSIASGPAHTVLADLMYSSSPRPMKTIRSMKEEQTCSRSTATGCLGRSKRRRVENPKGGLPSLPEQESLEAASKSSLVSALLNTVTSSMQERCEGGLTQAKQQSSPRQCHNTAEITSGVRSQKMSQIADHSDYSDDDLDDAAFIELEASIVISGTQELSLGVTKPDLNNRNELPHMRDVKSEVISEQTPNCPSLLKGECAKAQDEFYDELGEDFDFDAVELAATQSFQQSERKGLTNARKPKIIQRYLIKNVVESEYSDEQGRARSEKILLIQAEKSKFINTLRLRGSWYDTPAHPDAYVHVIGDFSPSGQCIINDAQNLLILHPDQLISTTVVGDSFGCMRRAVLQDRVKATSESSAPLVYGTMLHEIFQEALMANNWELNFLYGVIDENCKRHTEDLYVIKVSYATAREHLQSKMTELSYWAKAFVSSEPKPEAMMDDRNGSRVNVAITKLLDVEEHVWSPMYGLKGNIDATVEVTLKEGSDTRRLTVPFELKTGKNANSSHTAQTALYTLLLSDRYDINIAHGILYYMETSKTLRIPAIRHELRHMIMQRNRLACYIRERSVQLPPMLKSKHMCGSCYAQASCFTYHSLADDGDGESSGMGEKFTNRVKHLSKIHQAFFLKWENLLTKEEKESQKTKRELWTMTSIERQKKSRCFADVIVEEGSSSNETSQPSINRFRYTFVQRLPQPGFSFLESELHVGEPIVVSDEDGHYALAIGYVTAVRRQRISVAVDRRLHNARIRQPGFDEEINQVFTSIMEVLPAGSSPVIPSGKQIDEPVIRYRLDQDEFSNGMATVRNNLVQLMSADSIGARQIRRLVVDLAPPRFRNTITQYWVSGEGGELNIDQKNAVEKVMSAEDYALVLGMPGTGKTTTIAYIIQALVSQGKSVLLTSHTHTAVDNILLKLRSANIPILRLGAPAKIHPEVQEFVKLAVQPKETFEEIKAAWHDSPIVATTCLGIKHPIFMERSFDYCIVDEASQITLPICAGPIQLARTFVLVGDHNQLPPVVKNEEARLGGLDVSLFKLLSEAHPKSVVNLAHQYRMCEDIMTLSNTLIYNGQLQCGTESLRHKKLHVPNKSGLIQRHYDASTLLLPGTPRSFCPGPIPNSCWLQDVIDGEARVRFLNTDTIQPLVREEAQGKRVVNSSEVRIVSQIVDSLLSVGIPSNEIGVMTHYRAQLFLLKERLKMHSGVEMHTTDRFQGRDKEAIILSLVRSNDACNIGDLLKDWRRINVAFTRAKTKLLVVGSLSTLKNSGKENMLSKFVSLMEERDWVYNLPSGALEDHYFEEFGTQATAPGHTQPKPRSPLKTKVKAGLSPMGKENRRPTPKKARIGEAVLLKGKPITRCILNEMTNGAY